MISPQEVGSRPSRPVTGYRPDIDGLRAIAVMLVVLDHVGLPWFSGGFIGVDVFLVISGYLITGMILSQRSAGAFSFGMFYLRRAQRLLPPLFTMMLVVVLCGYYFLLPSDYDLLAQSALSAIALSSNIFFWLTSEGYFSPNAASLPLLHVWSLSLEEQFYLVWPATLVLLQKVVSTRTRSAIVASIVMLSFGLAQYGIWQGWSGVYFLLPSRTGEFLLGAMLSLSWKDAGTGRQPLAADGVSAAGLLLILTPAVTLNEHSAFPGLGALGPCLGAALIIAAPRLGAGRIYRLLSSRPAVGLGLISYSVYLWHWPLVAYAHYAQIKLTHSVALGVIAVSITLGFLSWRFIELGFRAWLSGPTRAPGIIAAGVTALLLAATIIVSVQSGLPQRFSFALPTQEQLTVERNRYWRDLPIKQDFFSLDRDVRQVLIVGDSHAYDLAYSLIENGFNGQLKLIETYHQCYNFGHDAVLPKDASFCAERLQTVLNSTELRVADAVYLHDHWGGTNLSALLQLLEKIREISPAPIYVFGPKMVFTQDVLHISQNAQDHKHINAASINDYAQDLQTPEIASLDRELRAFFLSEPVVNTRFVSWLDIQCGDALACDILSKDGNYLYFDASHFTLLGSRLFGARLKQSLPELF